MVDELKSLEALLPLGVGGLLAALMFLFYRKDTLDSAKRWEGQSALLVTVVKENTAAITSLIEVVRARRS